jgi:hypothetical protein
MADFFRAEKAAARGASKNAAAAGARVFEHAGSVGAFVEIVRAYAFPACGAGAACVCL